ncbi:MAG: integrin [Holophaga sp.]|nr:integrin [Holophaga sp.]
MRHKRFVLSGKTVEIGLPVSTDGVHCKKEMDMGTTSVRNSLIRFLCVPALALLLTACGGGGGGSTTTTAPPAPTLAMTPQAIKTFRFTWADVAGETEYRLLEARDGGSGFTTVATIPANATSYDLETFLPGRLNALYRLQACNAAGCTDSAEIQVSGTLAAAVGYVKASNTGTNDEFGQSLALSADGATLAVGAYGEASGAVGIDGDQNDNTANRSGAVYVFTRSGGTWSQQAYVKASNTQVDDMFGYRLALSADGNTLAVGAVGEDSNATGLNGNQTNNDALSSGAVYVFTRSGTAWSQQAYVKASNTVTGGVALFGISLALSDNGTTLAVGGLDSSDAIGIGGNQNNKLAYNSGAVYVFIRSGTAWSQQAYVKASNTGAGDWFGNSLALSSDGSAMAVGAPYEASDATGINGNQASNAANQSGAVYVFNRSGTVWFQQAYVKASNTGAQDEFGASLALSGDGSTLAVAATSEDSNGSQTDNSAFNSGAVYVFIRSGTTWSQQAYVKASNNQTGDRFGSSLALSIDGSTMAVGAVYESSNASGIGGNQANDSAANSGAVYVFTRLLWSWSQQAYVKASNPGIGDRFGDTSALVLSSDGRTLAIGAFYEDSNASGIGGDQNSDLASNSGAVYLY